MNPVCATFLRPLHAIAIAASLLATSAYANEYAEVSQLMRAGKLPEAMNRASQYLASNPKDPQMRFLKGVIQRESGRTMDAIATFSRLTEDYPELPEPYNNLAVLYAAQNQYDKARAALEMAIRTNPSYAIAHENLGDVYAKLASQSYNKALQIESGNQSAAPKLELIREIVGPYKNQNPNTTPRTPAAPPPAPVVSKPAAPTIAATPTPQPTLAAPKAVPPAPTVTATPAATVPATVAPAATSKPAASSTASDSKDVESAVRAWASAWGNKDMRGYLGAYGSEFSPPGGATRSAWEKERRQRITSKNSISVRIENLQVSVNGNKATVEFRQHYKADSLSVSSRKTLDLVKKGARWQIVKESTGS